MKISFDMNVIGVSDHESRNIFQLCSYSKRIDARCLKRLTTELDLLARLEEEVERVQVY